MKEVVIKRTPNADTRSMVKLDYDLVFKDTKNHIKAVSDVMNELAQKMIFNGYTHDVTKTEYFDEFFEALSSKKTGSEFKNQKWWKERHLQERHHLNDRVPEDVNLLDVIEMVVDCVCAGMARTGTIYDIHIDNIVLQKAILNTQQLIESIIRVEKE